MSKPFDDAPHPGPLPRRGGRAEILPSSTGGPRGGIISADSSEGNTCSTARYPRRAKRNFCSSVIARCPPHSVDATISPKSRRQQSTPTQSASPRRQSQPRCYYHRQSAYSGHKALPDRKSCTRRLKQPFRPC